MITIHKDIIQLMKLFPGSFINSDLELILVPKENIYFRLEDVKSSIDLKCKVIAYLSRPSCKGTNNKVQKLCLARFNAFFNSTFSEEDMTEIYTYLGNNCNREKTIRFIHSGYNLDILCKEKN